MFSCSSIRVRNLRIDLCNDIVLCFLYLFLQRIVDLCLGLYVLDLILLYQKYLHFQPESVQLLVLRRALSHHDRPLSIPCPCIIPPFVLLIQRILRQPVMLIRLPLRVRLPLQYFKSMEHFKHERIQYLDYYNNRRIKAKLKGLPPALHRQQALSAA